MCPGAGDGGPPCAGVGSCDAQAGTCACPEGRAGADCSLRACPAHHGAACAGRGDCDLSTGRCACRAPWQGDRCAQLLVAVVTALTEVKGGDEEEEVRPETEEMTAVVCIGVRW